MSPIKRYGGPAGGASVDAAGETLQSGQTTVASTIHTVVFPKAYSEVPDVVATTRRSGGGAIIVTLDNITLTGFTAYVSLNNGSGTSENIQWIARGT